MATTTLPKQNDTVIAERILGKPIIHPIACHWRTFEDQALSLESLMDVFANRAPIARSSNFFSDQECEKMLEIAKGHRLGSYNETLVWPRIGVAGITVYDYLKDPQRYWDLGPEARSLQTRWKEEAGIDVVARVMELLRTTTGMTVRLAREGDKDYFAGVLRAVDKHIDLHADYAPYDTREAPEWEISGIIAQATWNILLNEIPGGDTLVHDKQWQTPEDDLAFRKEFPRYAYQPQVVQGHPFKAMRAIRGDLTLFNSRNFHEVRPVDTSKECPVPPIRFTISSFVGLLPATDSEPATLVLWS